MTESASSAGSDTPLRSPPGNRAAPADCAEHCSGDAPARLEALTLGWRVRDLEMVRRAANQLKCECGRRGLREVEIAAAGLESRVAGAVAALSPHELEQVGREVGALVELCRQAGC